MRQTEKEKAKFYSRIPFILDRGKKIPKKIAKKTEKIKNPLSEFIFSLNGMRQAEKKRKKFDSRIPFVLDPGQKIPKKMTKKFYFRMPFILDLAKKIPKEIVKKLKKFKNHFPTLFLAKTG